MSTTGIIILVSQNNLGRKVQRNSVLCTIGFSKDTYFGFFILENNVEVITNNVERIRA
jgi:hypothetical protein